MWLENWNGAIAQGVIVECAEWKVGDSDIPLGVVLSNDCDLEHDKCGYIILLGLVDASLVITSSKEYLAMSPEKPSKKQEKAIHDYFASFIHNKDIRRYYFIGDEPEIGTPSMVIDFQLIKSIPFIEASTLNPIARIRSPFKEQMIVHFAGYTSRIPSDRVSTETEHDIINSLTKSDSDI